MSYTSPHLNYKGKDPEDWPENQPGYDVDIPVEHMTERKFRPGIKVGTKIDHLTVVRYLGVNIRIADMQARYVRMYLVRCDCGTEEVKTQRNLVYKRGGKRACTICSYQFRADNMKAIRHTWSNRKKET